MDTAGRQIGQSLPPCIADRTLGNPPHFFLLVQSVRVDTFHCAFAGRRKLHIHFSTLPFPAASQACGWGIWGGAWRQKPHAAFRHRAGAPSPYPLPASSYSKRKSSLRLEPEHAKGGCGPPFGIPQRLTLAVKLPWHYRVTAHPCIQRWLSSGANASGSRAAEQALTFWRTALRVAHHLIRHASRATFPSRGRLWAGALPPDAGLTCGWEGLKMTVLLYSGHRGVT